MTVVLLLLVGMWAVFRALIGRARLPESAMSLLFICYAAFYLRFDQVSMFARYAALITVFLLVVLIINGLRRPGNGKPFGYVALFGAGLIVYFGFVSNHVQGWKATLANIDTPLWNGTFYVVQGGNNLLVNGHRLSSRATAQRHALDIVKLSQAGASASRLFPGDDLSRFVVYTEPVYAPCNGTVLLMEDGFEDLPAGESDAANPAGNYIAIGCEEGFTVVLAHLRRGISGSLGERVRAGGFVGRVGNSGNTTEPHLHIHAVAGLVKDEREALFTGDGIPFTVNNTVLFKNTVLWVNECPPVPGIDLLMPLTPA